MLLPNRKVLLQKVRTTVSKHIRQVLGGQCSLGFGVEVGSGFGTCLDSGRDAGSSWKAPGMDDLTEEAWGAEGGWVPFGQCHSGSGLKPVEVMMSLCE